MTETPHGDTPRRWRIRRTQDTPGKASPQGEPGDPQEQLKHEVAQELGLEDDLANPDELSVREAGKIGGQMVRRLIRAGEKEVARTQQEAGEENPDTRAPRRRL